uniref:Uncharacterized protein n=1 Tax=Arundo donax TaxID=35708 RepID=A0A0A8ZWG1_ARUDO
MQELLDVPAKRKRKKINSAA